VVRLRRLVVELSVWLSQPHGQLQGRLYLPRLFVYYHYFAAYLSYPAARRRWWLVVENSVIRLCGQFFSKIDLLQILRRGQHFGSRMFEVRQQAGHHDDDHREPSLDIQMARLS
jgi:hypothetical protein